MPEDSVRFLKISEIEKITGLDRRTIYRMIANDEFPKQKQLSSRRVGWLESEINDWIDSR